MALVHDRGYGHHGDTSLILDLLAEYGVTAAVSTSFGAAELPPGLHAVTGVRS